MGRLAVDRVGGPKTTFYCLTPEDAAAMAAPEFGGRGAAAAGSSATVAGEDGPARCHKKLLSLLDCQAEQMIALVMLAGPVRCWAYVPCCVAGLLG